MNTTNRIQYLRKFLGLSQEELGEKMFVSRQTVSQWETGQTMPSIESLIKLHEIFGVSVDEILGILPEEKEEKAEEQEQAESHTFMFEADEIKEVLSFNAKNLKKKVFWLWFFTALCLFAMFGEISYGIFFGIFLVFAIMYTKSLLKEKRILKTAIEKVPGKMYTYAMSEGELIIKISEGERFISEEHIPLEEIESITNTEGYYIITVSGRSYIIRKENLEIYSKLLFYLKSHPKLTVMPTKKAEVWRALSIITVIASYATVLCGFIISVSISEAYGGTADFRNYMWVMFLLLPIPIFSIVLGCILKRKGMKYKKNIIAGIIMFFLLCIYGSFAFIF